MNQEMNIEKVIGYIKKRPYMYIGELNFNYLHQFLGGFLYYAFSTQRADEIDKGFQDEFHDWTRKWLEKNEKIFFTVSVGYDFYIQSICETQQECFDLFFKLCDIFFKELHDRID